MAHLSDQVQTFYGHVWSGMRPTFLLMAGSGTSSVPALSQLPPITSYRRYRSISDYFVCHTSESLIRDMSQTSSSPSLLFDVALRDYAKETGTDLDDHPLSKELEICDDVDSIFTVLKSQAQRLHEFRGEDGKIMKSLKSVIHVLYDLSNRSAVGDGIGIVCPTALIASVLFCL